jgi:hypothetical protein
MCLHELGNISFLSFTQLYKDIWRSGGRAPSFLPSELDGGEWLSSRPCRFTTGKRALGIHWIGRLGELRVGLHDMEKRKILHCLELKPGRQAHSPSLYRLSCCFYEVSRLNKTQKMKY